MQYRQILRNVKQLISIGFKAHPTLFASLLIVQLIQGSIPIANAWVIASVINLVIRVISDAQDTAELIPWLAFYGILTIVLGSLGTLGAYLESELARKIFQFSSIVFYENINQIHGLEDFENAEFQDSIQIVQQELPYSPGIMLFSLVEFLQGTVTVIGFVGSLLALSPILTIVLLFTTVPLIVLQLKVGDWRYALLVEDSPKTRKASYLGNLLIRADTVKELRVFNLSDYVLEKYLATVKKIHDAQRIQAAYSAKWEMVLRFVHYLVATAGFLYVVQLAISAIISIGEISFYISAINGVTASTFMLIHGMSQINERALILNQLHKLRPPSSRSPAKPLRNIPALTTAIEVKNLVFSYTANQAAVLENLNLRIEANKITAVVGLNGVGKTTLVKLLSRLYVPDSGQIYWDNVDLARVEPADLRKQIGVIFQDFNKYSLSATENIRLGNIQKPFAADSISQVAKLVGIHDRLNSLTDEYDTILSRWLIDNDETGTDLSGGEWQKIALARLLYRDAELLILDEPTAALDVQSEIDFFHLFKDMCRGKTALIISHRFSTVRMADFIAVLNGGRIVEYGTHDELIALGGQYSTMYQQQLSFLQGTP